MHVFCGWRKLPVYFIWGCVFINNELMINDEIREREVRVVGSDGQQLGVMLTARALELAGESNLDLVMIAPQGKPPVCKIMDYGKFRFEQSKRERELRKNQKIITVKEVRLSSTIDEHDIAVRVKNAEKFLKEGDKVKVTIRFRGRQITHSDIGAQVMNDFVNRLEGQCIVERRPAVDGRHMIMILAPKAEKQS